MPETKWRRPEDIQSGLVAQLLLPPFDSHGSSNDYSCVPVGREDRHKVDAECAAQHWRYVLLSLSLSPSKKVRHFWLFVIVISTNWLVYSLNGTTTWNNLPGESSVTATYSFNPLQANLNIIRKCSVPKSIQNGSIRKSPDITAAIFCAFFKLECRWWVP